MYMFVSTFTNLSRKRWRINIAIKMSSDIKEIMIIITYNYHFKNHSLEFIAFCIHIYVLMYLY